MAEDSLTRKIDQLKRELHQMVAEKGLSDPSVVALSQELDIYIVQYQHRHEEMKKNQH
ncbi:MULTISPECIES: aspartyl-phosphate phosphatase Spo0E family protein [Brevibacillus]|uniref:aspartyl-phosphate phosphatase Spo0E family protein n=1 Tax=Brevibacillus TaxID=55080 RepID=UPI00156BBA4B|nr:MULTISPECIES: aspartyl-phosphate phosphatase Spo0E family protein [Brevibacillus]MED1723970.1 aspartyl-phosphate phosphatase Spo0E family protein [Brevibacillus parabrevis]NRQ51918.1 aspartyl-phosphate phosphatase Spo0E family protein [Brevibacillus sp. HD1.4A]